MTALEIEQIQQSGAYQALSQAIGDKLWHLRKASEEAQKDNFKEFDNKMAQMRELMADIQTMHGHLLTHRFADKRK